MSTPATCLRFHKWESIDLRSDLHILCPQTTGARIAGEGFHPLEEVPVEGINLDLSPYLWTYWGEIYRTKGEDSGSFT
jgi:hypothetical protein